MNPSSLLQRVRAIQDRVVMQEKPGAVRAVLTMPNGQKCECVLRCASPAELSGELDALMGGGLAGEDDELAGFLSKVKKGLNKTFNPIEHVKLAHKITHSGPLDDLHKKVQAGVAKALPITKPFIKVHNSLAAPVHKAIEAKKIKDAVTAKEIVKATKNLPAAVKPVAQAQLAARAKQDATLKSIAKATAKAQVLSQAKKAAKKGDAEAKGLLKRAAQGTKGTYKVTTPSGRTVNVPAAKVAHT